VYNVSNTVKLHVLNQTLPCSCRNPL